MIGYYNYTVIPTCMGLASSVLGMVLALNGNLLGALICLMVSGFLDMIDGTVASFMERTEKEKRFGIQLDSLSDIVCFGVLPIIIGIVLCGINIFSCAVFCFYPICALIRLAYFNVDEEERQNATTERRKFYEGLPVTTVSVLIPFLFCFKPLTNNVFSYFYLISLIVIGIAFLVRFKLKKPGNIGKLVLGIIGLLTLICLLIVL